VRKKTTVCGWVKGKSLIGPDERESRQFIAFGVGNYVVRSLCSLILLLSLNPVHSHFQKVKRESFQISERRSDFPGGCVTRNDERAEFRSTPSVAPELPESCEFQSVGRWSSPRDLTLAREVVSFGALGFPTPELFRSSGGEPSGNLLQVCILRRCPRRVSLRHTGSRSS